MIARRRAVWQLIDSVRCGIYALLEITKLQVSLDGSPPNGQKYVASSPCSRFCSSTDVVRLFRAAL
jgi:hypothetical protein